MDLENNDGGIHSLSGFTYQIRVFVYYMTKMEKGDQMEFETLEDVVFNNSNRDQIDKKSDNFRSVLRKENSHEAIQVKRTNISKESCKKILYNWILLESKNENYIERFTLFTDGSNNNTDLISNIKASNLYQVIIKSTKKSNALVSMVKSKFSGKEKEFELILTRIQGKYSFVAENDLDKNISTGFSELFRQEAVSELTYSTRIIELLRFISYEIFKAIDKKSQYIFTHKSMMQKIEDICSRVKDDDCEIDFTTFRDTRSIDFNNPKISESREYKQLSTCNLEQKRIEDHITYQLYYESLRLNYLEDNNLSKVNNIETTTYDNFCDVVEILKQNKTDAPIQRLHLTKAKVNSYTSNEQIRFGSCIHLTTNSTDEKLKISWEDGNGQK